MSLANETSLRTRRTLLSRLRNLDDLESWRTFFDLYWRLLYNVARRSGLDDAVAQDVVQETVIGVAREMPEFRYDPLRGSFKQWLLRIVRRRIIDHLRRTYRQPPNAGVSPDSLDEDEIHAAAISAPSTHGIDAAWDEEWERTVFEAALARVQSEVNPKHFQVFDYCVLKEWPAAKVAATLGLNLAQVYLAKHRVSQAIKRAARQINDKRSKCP
ncbi:MAG: sigma-70 family RNA polymerase sigma factor [Verrucomicrobiota bacterium]